MKYRIAQRLIAFCVASLMSAFASCPAIAATTVYSNDFENGVGKEWSSDKIEVTPKDNRHFLGGFTTDKLTFKVDKIPAHKFLRISMKLYIMMSWDGNGTTTPGGMTIGPDVFRMNVEGGPMLVDATFSNMDFEASTIPAAANTQSYPSVLPGDIFPAKTGAVESNSLGFEWNTNRINRQMDSVYQLSFVIPHEQAEMQLNFQGAEGLAPADDECWGLDDVKIEALGEGEVKKLDVIEMRKLWETIGGHDPVAEAEAFWRLAAGGDEVAKFMGGKIRPLHPDKKLFNKLVAQLDGDDFQGREKATDELKEMGPAIEGLLRDAIEKADSAEVKLRLETALKGMAQAVPVDPEMRRRAIGMKLLKVIGTKEAEKVAGELSGK